MKMGDNYLFIFIYLCIFETFTPVFRVMFKVYISYWCFQYSFKKLIFLWTNFFKIFLFCFNEPLTLSFIIIFFFFGKPHFPVFQQSIFLFRINNQHCWLPNHQRNIYNAKIAVKNAVNLPINWLIVSDLNISTLSW